MNKVLTFELDDKNELLEIHGNTEGLLLLRDKIGSLILGQGADHIHMMVPSWGGEELSEENQCHSNVLIPHVKICRWQALW